jgi:hypothetical protein
LTNDQLQLEQRAEVVKDDEEKEGSKVKIITKMKRLGGVTVGVFLLRGFYTLVALLMCGFTFVFAANVIVMQAMEIPRNSGEQAGTSVNVPVLIAT